MGGRNRLLNFRHTRTSTLEIKSPGAGALLSGLLPGWDFEHVAAPGEGAQDLEDGVSLAKRARGPAPAATGIVTRKSTQALLDRSLTQLRSTSGRMYDDYGLWVLWLGVGMLEWREEGAHEGSRAPLVLVPAELVRDRAGRTRLRVEAHGLGYPYRPRVRHRGAAGPGLSDRFAGSAGGTPLMGCVPAGRPSGQSAGRVPAH